MKLLFPKNLLDLKHPKNKPTKKKKRSKKSPTGPTERTPKPDYLIALASNLQNGVRGKNVQFLSCQTGLPQSLCLVEKR